MCWYSYPSFHKALHVAVVSQGLAAACPLYGNPALVLVEMGTIYKRWPKKPKQNKQTKKTNAVFYKVKPEVFSSAERV